MVTPQGPDISSSPKAMLLRDNMPVAPTRRGVEARGDAGFCQQLCGLCRAPGQARAGHDRRQGCAMPARSCQPAVHARAPIRLGVLDPSYVAAWPDPVRIAFTVSIQALTQIWDTASRNSDG